MTSLASGSRGPGFQCSETSSAHLVVYPQPTDPILSLRNPDAGRGLTFTGRSSEEENPSLVALSTSKELGAPAGNWTATVKQGMPFARRHDLRDLIADDAWVDIHFSRHNRRTFTMRGMVDEIRRLGDVTRDGATSAIYTITGRDFGKVWDLTPLWFNKYVDGNNPPENVAGAAAMRVFSSLGIGGSVDAIVRAYLFGFLEELGDLGRANWKLPAEMPGVGRDYPSFSGNVDFDHTGFTNDPPRVGIAPNFLDPDGANAWAMAQEWSDPTFVELWSDLTPDGVFGREDTYLSTDIARMTVIARDRPFPTIAEGMDSPWFKLPTVEVPREDAVRDDLGRGGMERFNAFFVSPQVLQELLSTSSIEVTAPLWDPDDMLVHGFRRFDVNSKYTLDINALSAEAANDSLLTITAAQREKARDWYAINPYLHSGTVPCGRGVLEARVGKRLRIPGRSSEEDFTAYIEQVSHDWRFGQGVKTSLGVTRGWYGTDDSYMQAIKTLASRYGGNRQGTLATLGLGLIA